MDVPEAASSKQFPVGFDPTMAEEYTSLSKSLLGFTDICSIDKAWVFNSGSDDSKAMFTVNQPNLVENSMRKSVLSAQIRKVGNDPVVFEWSAFPVEITGVSLIVPSPSGSKLLMVRNPVSDSPTKFEIWGSSALEKEFQIPPSVHGSVYSEGWFEGVSWNVDETLIAYVAEEPCPPKPIFNMLGYENEVSTDKNYNSWKGQGVWEEDWGETYENQRTPTLFVINVDSGEVRAVDAIKRSMSAGQVIWAPETKGSQQHLIFVGWFADPRKLGIESCFNRPCALYAVESPFNESTEKSELVILTGGINSAFFPKFSPDGKFLIFISAKASVDSGVVGATDSLRRLDWPSDGKLPESSEIINVVPVVMCPDDGCFPGLYWPKFYQNPWLSDGHTVILSSIWGSTQVILSVDILSGNVSRVTPDDSTSWNLVSLDEDNIIAVCSSLVEVPKLKYGLLVKEPPASASWRWQDVSSPIFRFSKEVESSLSRLRFCIMKIPARGIPENSSKGASKPFDAIFVSAKTEKSNGSCNPLIVVLHGGPHSVITTGFSKYLGFLSSIGNNLLIVNYRGSLGSGEEALQSLPGKIGVQDVGDVLTAIDHVIEMKLADPSKISVLGGSHGGFLTTHLISQAPEKFAAAVAKNPVCNLALMTGTSDILDWCFVETYGAEGKAKYTDVPSKEHMNDFYDKSPIALVDKVKTPTLILLGAKDLRVPYPIGLQYSRALKERGVETKLMVFPEDNHGLDKPQCDFESNLNVGVWFKKYCK